MPRESELALMWLKGIEGVVVGSIDSLLTCHLGCSLTIHHTVISDLFITL